MLIYRTPKLEDLDRLLVIENAGFTAAEAATKAALIQRITEIPDTFIVAEDHGQIVGYINGPVIQQAYISDDLFEKTTKNPALGGYQSVLGLATAPQQQGQGIASALIAELIAQATVTKRQAITLTCKQELIGFYEKNGFINEGPSESIHGNIPWYNLLYYLP